MGAQDPRSSFQRSDDPPIIVLNSDLVRVELFKLNYLRGEFVLNDKADAQECLNFILTMMHVWVQACTTKPDKERARIMASNADQDVTIKLEKLSKVIKCQFSDQAGADERCFIHNMYYLHHL